MQNYVTLCSIQIQFSRTRKFKLCLYIVSKYMLLNSVGFARSVGLRAIGHQCLKPRVTGCLPSRRAAGQQLPGGSGDEGAEWTISVRDPPPSWKPTGRRAVAFRPRNGKVYRILLSARDSLAPNCNCNSGINSAQVLISVPSKPTTKQIVPHAVTRIRTWVIAATTRGTNHYTITAVLATVLSAVWQLAP